MKNDQEAPTTLTSTEHKPTDSAPAQGALREALEFYADGRRYNGANQRRLLDDKYTAANAAYMKDVTRDGGDLARRALATLTSTEHKPTDSVPAQGALEAREKEITRLATIEICARVVDAYGASVEAIAEDIRALSAVTSTERAPQALAATPAVPVRLEAWIRENFAGHGRALRRETDAPLEGEPWMSMDEAKELTRQAVALFGRDATPAVGGERAAADDLVDRLRSPMWAHSNVAFDSPQLDQEETLTAMRDAADLIDWLSAQSASPLRGRWFRPKRGELALPSTERS